MRAVAEGSADVEAVLVKHAHEPARISLLLRLVVASLGDRVYCLLLSLRKRTAKRDLLLNELCGRLVYSLDVEQLRERRCTDRQRGRGV